MSQHAVLLDVFNPLAFTDPLNSRYSPASAFSQALKSNYLFQNTDISLWTNTSADSSQPRNMNSVESLFETLLFEKPRLDTLIVGIWGLCLNESSDDFLCLMDYYDTNPQTRTASNSLSFKRLFELISRFRARNVWLVIDCVPNNSSFSFETVINSTRTAIAQNDVSFDPFPPRICVFYSHVDDTVSDLPLGLPRFLFTKSLVQCMDNCFQQTHWLFNKVDQNLQRMHGPMNGGLCIEYGESVSLVTSPAVCDIFISYRREGGSEAVQQIHERLNEMGFKGRVFHDTTSTHSGQFPIQLSRAIAQTKDFIFVLSSGSLIERTTETKDWFIDEFRDAMLRFIDNTDCKAINILPIQLKGFTMPKDLPKGMEILPVLQMIIEEGSPFDSPGFVEQLNRFLLSKPIDPKSVPARLESVCDNYELILMKKVEVLQKAVEAMEFDYNNRLAEEQEIGDLLTKAEKEYYGFTYTVVSDYLDDASESAGRITVSRELADEVKEWIMTKGREVRDYIGNSHFGAGDAEWDDFQKRTKMGEIDFKAFLNMAKSWLDAIAEYEKSMAEFNFRVSQRSQEQKKEQIERQQAVHAAQKALGLYRLEKCLEEYHQNHPEEKNIPYLVMSEYCQNSNIYTFFQTQDQTVVQKAADQIWKRIINKSEVRLLVDKAYRAEQNGQWQDACNSYECILKNPAFAHDYQVKSRLEEVKRKNRGDE